LRGVLALEAAGAEVMTAAVDVSDSAAVAELIESVTARFGVINGLVHAAGVPPGGLLLTNDVERASKVLEPKVMGTRVLFEALDSSQLDTVVLCSSLNTVKGFPGSADYAAANAFLDAFARSAMGEQGPEVVSINWNRWREAGMAVDASGGPLHVDQGISNAEGADVLRRILEHRPGPVVLISEFELRKVLDSVGRDLPATSSATSSQSGETTAVPESSSNRPTLGVAYVEPSTETERKLVGLWQELFGITPIGVRDDFFELGGHSLLATRMLNFLLDSFPTSKLTLRSIFERSNVVELAELVDAANEHSETEVPVADETSPDLVALSELDSSGVDSLSDDEVTEMLRRLAEEDRS